MTAAALQLARDNFLAQRMTGIGGSDVAKILGMSKWGDAITVYLQKRGLIEDDETSAMERGRYREESILRWYADEHDAERLGGGFHQHPELPWLIANVDDEVSNGVDTWVVDAKKVSFKVAHEWGEEGSDLIPNDAFWQGIHYCHVRSRSRCDFVAEIGDHWPPRVFPIHRNDELYALVFPQLKRFWFDHVLRQVPPPPNFADPKVAEAVRALHPAVAIEPVVIDLPELMEFQVRRAGEVEPETVTVRTVDVASMIDFLKARQKKDEAIQHRLDALLRHHIGDGQVGRLVLDSGKPLDVKRIFNKGGARPASVVDPFDYLKLNWPKEHKTELSAAVRLLIEGDTNV